MIILKTECLVLRRFVEDDGACAGESRAKYRKYPLHYDPVLRFYYLEK